MALSFFAATFYVCRHSDYWCSRVLHCLRPQQSALCPRFLVSNLVTCNSQRYRSGSCGSCCLFFSRQRYGTRFYRGRNDSSNSRIVALVDHSTTAGSVAHSFDLHYGCSRSFRCSPSLCASLLCLPMALGLVVVGDCRVRTCCWPRYRGILAGALHG